VPRLRKIRADGAYGGEPLAEWCRGEGGRELEIVERERKAGGFEVLAKRRMVERTFGLLGRSRPLSKDCERRVQTGETMIEVATIRLLLRRLVPRT
jgi:putative transposase